MKGKETARNKLYLFSIVLLVAIICLIYGLAFHGIEVEKKEFKDDADKFLSLSETEVIKDITVDGLKVSETGLIQRTYGVEEKPAAFCST